MRLWTMQKKICYDELINSGVFGINTKYTIPFRWANENELFDVGFKRGYDWIVEKMNLKIGPPPENVEYPIWAWYKSAWKNKKPDMRYACNYVPQEEDWILMEIEVPDSEVLLTDFESYHFILNNWHVNFPSNEEEYNKDEKYIDSLDMNERQKNLEKSWDKVLDISELDNEYSRRGMDVQATFWQLKKEYIIKTWVVKNKAKKLTK